MSPLPNPGMSFTPFDQLPASDLNDLVENIEALQDGSAFDDNSEVTVEAIDNPYKFLATQTAGQSGISSATKVTFTNEVYDPNNDFSSSTYTAPVSGFYLFGAFVHATPTGGDTSASMHLYKNNSDYRRLSLAGGTNLDRGLSGSILIQLDAGDTVDIRIQSTGGNIGTAATGTDQPFFWGILQTKV